MSTLSPCPESTASPESRPEPATARTGALRRLPVDTVTQTDVGTT